MTGVDVTGATGRRRREATRAGRRVAAVATVLALAGCGAADEAAPDEPDSPLDAYLAVIWGESVPGDPNPWAIRAEELIAECMAQAGFEYDPDTEAGRAVYAGSPDVGTREFADEFGYGIFIEAEPGRPPYFWGIELPESEAAQRNREYRESLSPEALEQYDLAMNGDWSVYSDAFDAIAAGEREYDPADAGCSGRALQEVTPDGMAGPAELSAVKQAIRDMYLQVEQDPRVVEAAAAWGSCMADAGYPGMSQPRDAEDYLHTELWAEWQDRWAPQVPGTTGVTEYEVVKAEIPEGLAELQAAEIAVAVADASCREESGYAEVLGQVEAEVEQEIVDTYREDLDAWVAWHQEQEAERD